MNKKIVGVFMAVCAALSSAAIGIPSAHAQSIPDVSLTGFSLSKTDYHAGDTITGSFMLQDRMTSPVSGVGYFVSLNSTATSSVATATYGKKIFDAISLDARQTKSVSFSMPLPAAYNGDLSVHVEAFGQGNIPLAWSDIVIGVTGSSSSADVTAFSVVADGAKFGPNEGPTVTKSLAVSGMLSNASAAPITVTPQVLIYNKQDPSKSIGSASGQAVVIPAHKSAAFSVPLDNDGVTAAGVYLGDVRFLDSTNTDRAPMIGFRYIIGGDIVTLFSATLDRSQAKAGDQGMLTVSFAGSPYDIVTGDAPQLAGTSLRVIAYNERGQIAAQYDQPFDFNTGLTGTVPLSFMENASALRADIFAVKGDMVLSHLSTDLSPGYEAAVAKAKSDDDFKSKAVPAGIVLLIIAALVIFLFEKRKGTPAAGTGKKMMIAAFLLLSGFAVAPHQAQAFTIVKQAEYKNGTDILLNDKNQPRFAWLIPTVVLNNPPETLQPGDEFYIDSKVVSAACGNSPNRVVYTITYNGQTLTEKDAKHNKKVDDGKQHHKGEPTPDFEHDFVFGPFTAPTTPGTYQVGISVGNDLIRDGYFVRGRTDGYQQFTVATPPPATDVMKGYLDSASCDAGFTGWACDGTNFPASINVLIQDETGRSMTVPANIGNDEQGVQTLCNFTDNHRFSVPIPASWKDGSVHTYSAFGITADGSGQKELVQSPQTLAAACTPPPTSCTAPQVKDANGNCVNPPTSCVAPQVMDASGNCVNPPTVCTAPQVKDANGNCVNPPTVCTAPQYFDAATGTCVNPPVNQCPNLTAITGQTYATVPAGYFKDASGNCSSCPPANDPQNLPANYPRECLPGGGGPGNPPGGVADYCTNLPGYQTIVPTNYYQVSPGICAAQVSCQVSDVCDWSACDASGNRTRNQCVGTLPGKCLSSGNIVSLISSGANTVEQCAAGQLYSSDIRFGSRLSGGSCELSWNVNAYGGAAVTCTVTGTGYTHTFDPMVVRNVKIPNSNDGDQFQLSCSTDQSPNPVQQVTQCHAVPSPGFQEI